MIDTHAHLNFKAFDKDRDEVVKRCFESGIKKIINIGSQLPTSRTAVAMADNKKLFATVGIHPTHSDLAPENTLQEIEKLGSRPGVIAIGETGLDYFHKNNKAIRKSQADLFIEHIEMATRLDLPLVLHCRDAYEDMYSTLKGVSGLRGVMHCFGGDKFWAKKFLDLGLYIGFTGIVTFKNSGLDETVKYTPLDRILLETDCPYLAPEPYRGTRAEPWHIKFIAEKIAEIKGISYTKVTKETVKNSCQLFEI